MLKRTIFPRDSLTPKPSVESLTLPSIPPTPPPKDFIDAFSSLSSRLYTQEIVQRDVPQVIAKGNCDASISSSAAASTAQRGPENAIEKFLVSRPSPKRSGTFARLAPPRLTITPIFTTSPSPKAVATTKGGAESITSASKALRAVSNSKVPRKLSRRASLPSSFHSWPLHLSTEIPTSASTDDHPSRSSSRDTVSLSRSVTTNSPSDVARLSHGDDIPKLSRAGRRCLHAILELVESERAFVMDLNSLVRYTRSLVSDDALSLTDSQRRAVESLNVKELLRIHEPLSRQFGAVDIRGCVEGTTGDDMTITNALSEVAHAFRCFAEYRHIYEEYCFGHSKVLDAIRPVQTTPNYFAFEQKLAVLDSSMKTSPNTSPSVNDSSSGGGGPTAGLSNSSRRTPMSPASLSSSRGHSDVSFLAPQMKPGEMSSHETDRRTRSSASLTSKLSLRSLRRSIRWSPSSSRQPSRAPSPVPPPERSISSASLTGSPLLKLGATSTSRDNIPPVPPIPSSAFISNGNNALASLNVPTSKPLAFRDLLIKPIQRVCRYPLLLAQLRLPTSVNNSGVSERLERAITATRLVAESVDEAQERREVVAKSSLIVERLEPHPIVTQKFVRTLGQLILASSLEAILLSAATIPSKVKFVATFLYQGYLLLVEVRKNQTYNPWHWFPLQNSSVTACDNETAPPNSFVLYCSEHRMELAASCQEERAIWIRSLSAAAREEICAVELVKSSLQQMDDLAATNGHSSVTSTPKKRQSFFYNPTMHAGEAGARKTGSQSNNPEVPSPTVARTPSRIKRLSTASIASLFGPEQNTSSTVPAPRRSTPAVRHVVDRNIRDVVSGCCLAARAQARMNGELFQVPIRMRTRTLSSQNPSPPDFTARKRQTVDSADSFGLAKMSEESEVLRVGNGQEWPKSSPSSRRRTQSLPSTDALPQPMQDSTSRKHLDTLKPLSRRTVFDLTDDDPLLKGDSDDEHAESVWEGDDMTSPDFSSVEAYSRDASRPAPVNDPTPDTSEPDVILYIGKGITNSPPQQRRSLLRKSLFALSRRGAKGSLSLPVPDEHAVISVPTSSQARPPKYVSPTLSLPYRSLGAQLLSPHWTIGSRNSRPRSSSMRGDQSRDGTLSPGSKQEIAIAQD